MVFFCFKNIDISENAVFTEHILAFQIGSVAPFIYNSHKLIFSRLCKSGNIKFSSIMRALAVTYILTVDINGKCTGHTKKSQRFLGFGMINIKCFSVYACCNIFGNVRRFFRKRIAGVDICNLVISGSLPGAWNGYSVKFNIIGVKQIGNKAELFVIGKIPFSAEHNDSVRFISFIFIISF